MIKRILVTLIAFVTVFMTQSQSWAAANSAEKTTQAINVAIDKSTFLASDDAPAMIAKRMGDGGANSMMWIASIFVTGLGQILMGDLWRGLKFIFMVVGLWAVGVILGFVGAAGAVSSVITNPGAAAGAAGIFGIIGLVLSLGALAIHIWNIIDAYNMSQEQAGMSKLNEEQMAKLEQDMKTAMEVARKIQVSSNGAVSYSAFAF
ncbi:MAG: hypothetical protein U0354_18060 [Candidatus Sericytochromatia bacterium]